MGAEGLCQHEAIKLKKTYMGHDCIRFPNYMCVESMHAIILDRGSLEHVVLNVSIAKYYM